MICFYHDDLDGRCAAFWVRYFTGCNRTFPVDYKDSFPVHQIEDGEDVFIVDFMPEDKETLEKILSIANEVTIIDHHITHIQHAQEWGIKTRGIKQVGIAGCVLTYLYFNQVNIPEDKQIYDKENMDSIPLFTQLIGDRDIWAFKYGDQTRHFYEGVMIEDTNPHSELWYDLYNNEHAIDPIERLGEKLLRGKLRNNEEFLKAFGFETSFNGYRCIACNMGRTSSDLFKSIWGKYDIYIPFVFDGEKYSVSLYSETVDVSIIAKELGGGGHKGASGFTCKELPFKKEN